MGVLVLIVLVDFLAVLFVMWVGTRHDHHHDIQAIDSSEAVKMLRAKYAPPVLPSAGETPTAEVPPAESES